MSQLRYQVVYKKLVRSQRKFYTHTTTTSGYGLATDDCDKLIGSYLEYVVEEFGQQIHELRLDPEEVAISLGALTHPKLLLKHFKNNAKAAARV